jgi:hypothetical protein
MGAAEGPRRVTVQLSETEGFCDSCHFPRRRVLSRRPEPVSEISVAQPALSQGSVTLPRRRHLLGYARVSTTDQQPQLQVEALQPAGCYRVFT